MSSFDELEEELKRTPLPKEEKKEYTQGNSYFSHYKPIVTKRSDDDEKVKISFEHYLKLLQKLDSRKPAGELSKIIDKLVLGILNSTESLSERDLKMITIFLDRLNNPEEDSVVYDKYTNLGLYDNEQLIKRINVLVGHLLHYLKDPEDLPEGEKFNTEGLQIFKPTLQMISEKFQVIAKDGKRKSKRRKSKRRKSKRKSNKRKSNRKKSHKKKN